MTTAIKEPEWIKWPVKLENPEIADIHLREAIYPAFPSMYSGDYPEDSIFVYKKNNSDYTFGLLTKNKILTKCKYNDAFRTIQKGEYKTAVAIVFEIQPHHNSEVLIDLNTGEELVTGFAASRYRDGKYFSFRIDGENNSHIWGIYDMEARIIIKKPTLSYAELLDNLNLLNI